MTIDDEYRVDPRIWYAEREILYPFNHFITASTPLTAESKQWVLDYLTGRYSITQNTMNFLFDGTLGIISFEDPKEALIYELKWS